MTVLNDADYRRDGVFGINRGELYERKGCFLYPFCMSWKYMQVSDR